MVLGCSDLWSCRLACNFSPSPGRRLCGFIAQSTRIYSPAWQFPSVSRSALSGPSSSVSGAARGVCFCLGGVGPSPLSATAPLPSDQLPRALWPLFPTAPGGDSSPRARAASAHPFQVPTPPPATLVMLSSCLRHPSPAAVSCSALPGLEKPLV